MSVAIDIGLPAFDILKAENIDVILKDSLEDRDSTLKLAMVNLMPTKEKTELQFLRRISNTAFKVEVDLIAMKSHESKNTSMDHIDRFYNTIDEVKSKVYDAMIITGAPVEHMEFEDLDYWKELQEVLEFAKTNVFSTVFVCWASQAALYHYYGIKKEKLNKKLFGVYKCHLHKETDITTGFDESFYIPQSRHTYVNLEDVRRIDGINILSSSKEVGLNIAATDDQRFIFITGHGEYDKDTLELEYIRDLNKGEDIDIPQNYYIANDREKGISVKWRSHSSLLFQNWINFCGKRKFS